MPDVLPPTWTALTLLLFLVRLICLFKKQEPIQTSGYICNFEDLEIKSVLLDEIMKVNV